MWHEGSFELRINKCEALPYIVQSPRHLVPEIYAPLLYFTFSTVYETDPIKELLTSSRAIKLVPQTAHLLFMSSLYHGISWTVIM